MAQYTMITNKTFDAELLLRPPLKIILISLDNKLISASWV